jgi:hypothetical protein
MDQGAHLRGGKLFREGYAFAADKTVSNFIGHLKGAHSGVAAAAPAVSPAEGGGPAGPDVHLEQADAGRRGEPL